MLMNREPRKLMCDGETEVWIESKCCSIGPCFGDCCLWKKHSNAFYGRFP